MYEAFYGLRDKPFSMLPDPRFLYLSKKHQTALTLLEYGLMNSVGFCVISGETGAGKTTLLRKLLERIDDSYTVGMITNTHQSFGSLLDWILSAFNLHTGHIPQVEMHQKLMDFLIAEYAKNKKVLLIVDEAQNMKAEALEELRMLSNVNSEKDQLVQVILAGQPGLKETLRIPELVQFAQRIGVDYHLGTLNAIETCGYIQHRLITAGAEHDVFTPAACERIHNYSGGTPRLINLLCDTVMVYGFADQRALIDVDLVEEMVQERMKDSLVPLVNRELPKDNDQQAMEKLVRDFPSITSHHNNEQDGVAAEAASGTRDSKEPSAAAESDVDRAPVCEEPDAVVEKKLVINTVETLSPEPAEAAISQWKRYAIAAMGLIVVAFLLYRAGFLTSSAPLPEQALKKPANGNSTFPLAQARQALENEKKKLRKQAQTLQQEKKQALAKMAAEKNLAEKGAARAAATLTAAVLKNRQKVEKLEAAAKKRQWLAQQQARLAWQAHEKENARLLAEKRNLIKARLKDRQQLQKIEKIRQLEKAKRAQPLLQQSESVVATDSEGVKPEKKTKKFIDASCVGAVARFKSTCR